MSEEEIVKKVCEIMDIEYSHYDNHNMGIDYFSSPNIKLSSRPKIVVYSSRMGRWQFAILEDMTVKTITSDLAENIMKMREKMKKLGIKTDNREIDDELKKIKKAEKWLKKNKCQKVINDPKKKIHLEWND